MRKKNLNEASLFIFSAVARNVPLPISKLNLFFEAHDLVSEEQFTYCLFVLESYGYIKTQGELVTLSRLGLELAEIDFDSDISNILK